MVHDRVNRRMTTFGAAVAATAMLTWSAGEAVQAQTMMHSPSINIAPRITRINPNITGRVLTNVERFPRDPGCRDADRAGCSNQSSSFSDGGSSRKVVKQTRRDNPRRGAQGALNLRFVPNEIVAEIDGSLSGAGRRTGAASRPGAAAVAEFSADRRHHRPVPHHRPPLGRIAQPRIRRPKPAFARCSRISAICCRTRRRR